MLRVCPIEGGVSADVRHRPKFPSGDDGELDIDRMSDTMKLTVIAVTAVESAVQCGDLDYALQYITALPSAHGVYKKFLEVGALIEAQGATKQ